MMKSVQAATLRLKTTAMMMMMMMGSVSAASLPPSLNNSSRDDQPAVSPQLFKEENSTRFESRPNISISVDNFTRVVSLNTTMNGTSFLPLSFDRLRNTIRVGCVLSTCLTDNLGSALQRGDETAGGATTDPFGIGKK